LVRFSFFFPSLLERRFAGDENLVGHRQSDTGFSVLGNELHVWVKAWERDWHFYGDDRLDGHILGSGVGDWLNQCDVRDDARDWESIDYFGGCIFGASEFLLVGGCSCGVASEIVVCGVGYGEKAQVDYAECYWYKNHCSEENFDQCITVSFAVSGVECSCRFHFSALSFWKNPFALHRHYRAAEKFRGKEQKFFLEIYGVAAGAPTGLAKAGKSFRLIE
jgi:hypothetical protein